MSNFGVPNMVKWWNDSAGACWEAFCTKYCVGDLHGAADILSEIANYTNAHFPNPRTGDKAGLHKRYTIEVESVEHHINIWNSIPGTKKSFCYFLDPLMKGIWYRRYTSLFIFLPLQALTILAMYQCLCWSMEI